MYLKMKIVRELTFPLKTWLMKPFPGTSLSLREKVYNFRLYRSRRTIENALGIPVSKWRVFRQPIRAKLDLVDLIVQAAVCLHNYLILTENARYLPTGFVDSYVEGGDIVLGYWRNIVAEDQNPGLAKFQKQGSPNSTSDAKVMRSNFCEYVNDVGALAGQNDYVQYSGRKA